MADFEKVTLSRDCVNRKIILHSVYHGGYIDKIHRLICSTKELIGQKFVFTGAAKSPTKAPRYILDEDVDVPDSLLLENTDKHTDPLQQIQVLNKYEKPVTVLPEKILNTRNLEDIIRIPIDISILYEKGTGGISKRFIKPKYSVVFGLPDYSIDGYVSSIAKRTPQEDLFCSAFGIWIGGERVSDCCCRPTRMHEVWISLGMRLKQADHLALAPVRMHLRRYSTITGKHGISAVFRATKQEYMRVTEAYVPAYFISVFSGDINLVTTLRLPSE